VAASLLKPAILSVKESVTADPYSLLEAVRLLLSEVSELKDHNLILRKDMDAAQDEIFSLKNRNDALTRSLQTLQQQQRTPTPTRTVYHSRSTKLRGSADDSLDGVIQGALRERLAALENKVACVSEASNVYDIFFEGCNVHVRDGSGATEGTGRGAEQSGRGNLIVGYNEMPDPDEAPEICSNSSATDFAACRKTGGVWGQGIKTGIHNLIVGSGHSYTRHSGIIAGTTNAITGVGSVVLGGRSNVASGDYATVSGGVENFSSGKNSVVLGGFDNTASGDDSLVGGGSYNTASGAVSAVVGGENNQALGGMSFVAGGNLNRALGEYSCSTSSFATTATGKETSIAGGRGVIASLDETIVTGDVFGMKTIGSSD
jgi:FtsZ-binding cell division protein ZapB